LAEPPPPELLEQLGIEPPCICGSTGECAPARGDSAPERGTAAGPQYLTNTPSGKENSMRDIATATLTGNLTRDVDLRALPSGAEVARLRVATTTRRHNGQEWVDKTNYLHGPGVRRASASMRPARWQGLARGCERPSSTGASGPTNRTTGARRSPSGPARFCSRASAQAPAMVMRAARIPAPRRRLPSRLRRPRRVRNRPTPTTCRSESTRRSVLRPTVVVGRRRDGAGSGAITGFFCPQGRSSTLGRSGRPETDESGG
jgi:hypothetical protein